MITRLILLIGFLLAFAAGYTVGMNRSPAADVSTASGPDASSSQGRRGWLAQQLELTAEQQQQMREVWAETASRGGRGHIEQRRELRRHRDEAIEELIPQQNLAAYEQVIERYNESLVAMEREWAEAYERAVERTRAILTPQQREKYEQILSRQGWDGGPRDRSRPTRSTEQGLGD
jgi:Spy/CpxP family protein refolding chaperone